MNNNENTQHYYTENPTSQISEKQFTYKGLSFTSVSGVFGFSSYIDKASQLLIENYAPIVPTPEVLTPEAPAPAILDLGCGFGAIGLSVKSMYPSATVHLSDINNRAVEYAARNARANRLDVELHSGNLYEPVADLGDHFDDILSNPPIAVGKAFNTLLIQESVEHLKKGGNLWLVAFHNKGGATLRKIMKDTFGNVTDVVKSGGIRVYRSTLY